MSQEFPSPEFDIVAEATRALSPSFRGALIGPQHADYDDARRFWSGRYDKRPGLIAGCVSPADVMDVVRFARGRGIPVSVRSGRHDLSGYSVIDRGLVIDASRMKGLRVDPTRRTVRAEAGVVWRELTREAQAFGLATGGAVAPDVTVTGYGIGGGQNLLQRRYGLGCDNIVSIDLVTADAELLTTSEAEHSDLFWAMCGAGANFGVVTSIEYRLHPVHTVLAGKIVYALGDPPAARAREILSFLRDFNASAPDALTAYIYLMDEPAIGPSISLLLCCLGPIEEGEALLRPLRSFGPPAEDTVAPVSYGALQTMFDAEPLVLKMIHPYYKTHFVKHLDDTVIAALSEAYVEHRASGFGAILEPFDGAVRRVSPLANAFPEREADYCVLLFGIWMDPANADASVRPVRDTWKALAPFSTGRAYVNYLDDDELDRVPTAYGREIHERLRVLKKKYDPTNFFRANQNIEPAR